VVVVVATLFRLASPGVSGGTAFRPFASAPACHRASPFRALQDGRPEVKRGASGVESESLRDTAAMRPHRGLMRHRRESFSTGATATDSPLDGATRRAR
jgi:hypothetical protein